MVQDCLILGPECLNLVPDVSKFWYSITLSGEAVDGYGDIFDVSDDFVHALTEPANRLDYETDVIW